MKKLNTKIIMVTIGLLAMNQVAFAATAVLSSLPTTATSTVNTQFNISVEINPVDNKICVVKGTINLNKLTCQNISLASGIIGQTVPTCEQPNFTLGIPKCTTVTKSLFTVSVKGNQASQAGISFTGVKVIGAGTDVAFNAQGSTYNITAIQTASDKVAPVISLMGPNPMFVKVGANYVEQGAVATDNVDGDITSSIKIDGSVDTLVVKSYKITYSATDKAGNIKSIERTVVVNPVELNGNDSNNITPDTGIQIPSGVGTLDTSYNDNENVFTIVSTSSSEATTTAVEETGLIAAVSEGFSSIPNKPITALIVIAVAFIIDAIFFRRFSNITPKKS